MIEEQTYSLKSFIDNDLKIFSNLDNVRSIPSIIDGFKDSQRKAIFGALKSGSDKIKVAQLAGYAALITHYEHGETSMASTLIGLAQSFPGANNANLLEPLGQFGSILSDEASSPRYIYTKPSKLMRNYIKPEDDLILDYRVDEGETMEPINYFPVMPMWIVNGAIGIGTGHSCKILPRSPSNVKLVIESILSGNKDIANDDAMKTLLIPHFNNWKGKVVKGESDTQWELHGILKVVNTTTIRITELPVTYGVDKYKGILIDLMDAGIVKDYDNNSNESSFDFTVTVPREIGRKDEKELMQIFKLVAKFGENVTLWDTQGKLRRYDSVLDALIEFVKYRVERYQDRKEAEVKRLEQHIDWLNSKRAFILHWNTKLKDPHLKTDEQLRTEFENVVNEEYMDRLLVMPIGSLTMSKIAALDAEIEEAKKTKQKTIDTAVTTFFKTDLKSI